MVRINPVGVQPIQLQKKQKKEEENQVQEQQVALQQNNVQAQNVNQNNVQEVEEVAPAQNQEQQEAVTMEQVMAKVRAAEVEQDPDARNALADEAVQMIQQMRTQIENAGEQANVAAGNGHGKGKANGINNRFEMLSERLAGDKKLSKGHQKQLDRFAQNGGTPQATMTVLDGLEARVERARNNDPGMTALEQIAAQNKMKLQVQQQVQEKKKAEEAPVEEAA